MVSPEEDGMASPPSLADAASAPEQSALSAAESETGAEADPPVPTWRQAWQAQETGKGQVSMPGFVHSDMLTLFPGIKETGQRELAAVPLAESAVETSAELAQGHPSRVAMLILHLLHKNQMSQIGMEVKCNSLGALEALETFECCPLGSPGSCYWAVMLYKYLGHYDKAVAVLEHQIASAQDVADIDVRDCFFELGDCLRLAGQYDLALALFERCKAHFKHESESHTASLRVHVTAEAIESQIRLCTSLDAKAPTPVDRICAGAIRCALCGTMHEHVQRCAQCKMVKYCSRRCQKLGWKEHKKLCVISPTALSCAAASSSPASQVRKPAARPTQSPAPTPTTPTPTSTPAQKPGADRWSLSAAERHSTWPGTLEQRTLAISLEQMCDAGDFRGVVARERDAMAVVSALGGTATAGSILGNLAQSHSGLGHHRKAASLWEESAGEEYKDVGYEDVVRATVRMFICIIHIHTHTHAHAGTRRTGTHIHASTLTRTHVRTRTCIGL
jgi:tetratricopeptide (TPR) repeat protein